MSGTYWEQSLREAVEGALEEGKTLEDFMQKVTYELSYGVAARFAENEAKAEDQ